jgi:taurine dioxygenase
VLNYRTHENGWTIIIEDIDLRSSTQDDINEIAKLISTSTCVVIRNQFLTVEEELRIVNMFPNLDRFIDFVGGDKDSSMLKDLAADFEKDPDGILVRITGELRNGVQGGAGWNEDFVWHCNQPESPSRKPIVWLYGIRGTAGSRTSWTNSILAYKDLADDIKNRISGLHSIYGNHQAPKGTQWHDDVRYNTNWTPSLVHKNIANKIGMYFSPIQIKQFVEITQEESDELKNLLFDHILQEQYVYHHDWKDGDIVLSEQWLGVHKRWAFAHMDKRLLHRAAMDFPNQDYTN